MFTIDLACSWIYYCWCPTNIRTFFFFISIASWLVDNSQRHRQMSLGTSRRLDFTRCGCTQADLVPRSRSVAHTASWHVTTRNSAETWHTRLIVPQTIKCALPKSPQQRLQQSPPVWVEDIQQNSWSIKPPKTISLLSIMFKLPQPSPQ